MWASLSPSQGTLKIDGDTNFMDGWSQRRGPGLTDIPPTGHVSNFCGPQTAGVLRLTDQRAWNNIVIPMRAVHLSIRQIGNSQGVVIPKPILVQLGLDAKSGVEMTVEDGALVLRRPASPARVGWAEAARTIAEAGDDQLVMGEFGNAEDSELVW